MKTKRIIIACLLLAFTVNLKAQKIDYRSKIVKLIPESSYLPEADWNALFYDESQKDIPSKVGLNKQIRIVHDGSVFISDRSKFTITKLDKNGKVVKTFGKQGWNNGEFANNQNLDCIYREKLLVVSDNQGRINFFDLDGNFVKLITIDFMPHQIFPLKSGNLVVWGFVPWKGNSKQLLAELDYENGTYKQFYETLVPYDKKVRIKIPTDNGVIAIGSPYSAANRKVRITNDDKIIFAKNSEEHVTVLTKKNEKWETSEFKVGIKPIPIEDSEREEYYEKFKQQLIEKGHDPKYAEQIKEPGFYPEHLPYYYNLIVDGNSNCLFFVYSNENKDHLFQAYTIDGKYLGESEFKIEGYDLMSKLGYFTFIDGFVYTLALKHNEEVPLRILKCKVSSD
jgi:hypothetical protein